MKALIVHATLVLFLIANASTASAQSAQTASIAGKTFWLTGVPSTNDCNEATVGDQCKSGVFVIVAPDGQTASVGLGRGAASFGAVKTAAASHTAPLLNMSTCKVVLVNNTLQMQFTGAPAIRTLIVRPDGSWTLDVNFTSAARHLAITLNVEGQGTKTALR